jgi:hypothetical protein
MYIYQTSGSLELLLVTKTPHRKQHFETADGSVEVGRCKN